MVSGFTRMVTFPSHYLKLPACLLIALLALLVTACSGTDSKDESATQEPAAADSAVSSEAEDVSCVQDETVLLGGNSGEVQMKVLSALAVPRINLNEQTDEGNVAKPGWTICLADFDLSAEDPWVRPDSSQLKVELRLFTGDRSSVTTGVYRSPHQSNLQVGPVLYIDGKTLPIAFPKIGKVTVHEVTESHICGTMKIKTLTGLLLEGNFKAEVVEDELKFRPAG